MSAVFGQTNGFWSALPELFIRNGASLGDIASPKTTIPAKTGCRRHADDTIYRAVPVRVPLLFCATRSPLGCTEVELEFGGVVDPIQISEVSLMVSLQGGTGIWSNVGADVIFGTRLDAIFGFAAGLIVVFDFLVALGRACLGVVVALQVTLCQHEMSLRIGQTSLYCSFTVCVSPRRS